jgi:hypothetical protein
MRLAAKLLNTSATLNSFRQVNSISIARGETVDLFVQLVDLDQNGLRYIPVSGATLQMQLPRSNEVLADVNQTRQIINRGIARAAINPFPEDRSIWKVTLVEADTLSLVSNSLRLELTEGSTKKITSIAQAIRVGDGQDL